MERERLAGEAPPSSLFLPVLLESPEELVCRVSCVLCRVSSVLCPVSCILCPVSCILCRVSCVVCRVPSSSVVSGSHELSCPGTGAVFNK
ncbi:hypothetical protein J6590_087918 [Homalodisca vitripennis]|nr:hypothetical protein J6590_080144 [Homalodisca vitripennis]KAG8334542.1 hypothetical protein J6590_087918 [Homalodisca vitripennis]